MRKPLAKLMLIAAMAFALSGCGANYSMQFTGPSPRNAPPYR
jgi:predicted small lipoprotein YifL